MSLKKTILNLIRPEKGLAFEMPDPSRMEARAVEQIFARVFSTEDGKKVMSHLAAMTFMRAAAMDAPDDLLRHLEGQRALMATIMRLTERGRQ